MPDRLDPYLVIAVLAVLAGLGIVFGAWRFAVGRLAERSAWSLGGAPAPTVSPALAVAAAIVAVATLAVTGFWWLMVGVGMLMDDRAPEESSGAGHFLVYLAAVLAGVFVWGLVGHRCRRSIADGDRSTVVVTMLLWPASQFLVQLAAAMAINALA